MAKIKKHGKSPPNIYAHLARNSIIGLVLIALALSVGMCGYHIFEKMSWIDSFYNASMILSGMGPSGNLSSGAGKLFAGAYALFSGLAFAAIIVIMLSPVIHMFFRKLHIEMGRSEDD